MKSSITLLLFAVATSLLFSCSQKVGFQTSTVVSAARGDVKVTRDNNKNYVINLDVQMLSEPNRLPIPKSVYVVWMETENNGLQNLGQLRTNSGLFSSKLKASLKATSPYKPRRVFVTAEDNVTVILPGSYVVLNTNSF